jgi:hypothetical protein
MKVTTSTRCKSSHHQGTHANVCLQFWLLKNWGYSEGIHQTLCLAQNLWWCSAWLPWTVNLLNMVWVHEGLCFGIPHTAVPSSDFENEISSGDSDNLEKNEQSKISLNLSAFLSWKSAHNFSFPMLSAHKMHFWCLLCWVQFLLLSVGI